MRRQAPPRPQRRQVRRHSDVTALAWLVGCSLAAAASCAVPFALAAVLERRSERRARVAAIKQQIAERDARRARLAEAETPGRVTKTEGGFFG